MSQYLRQTKIFPPMATYLINTGEQSGKLDAMLLTVGENSEKELEEFSNGLSDLIGPIMLIVTGVVVGFVVLSILLPVTQMTSMM